MMKYNIIQTDENNIETTKQYAKLTVKTMLTGR